MATNLQAAHAEILMALPIVTSMQKISTGDKMLACVELGENVASKQTTFHIIRPKSCDVLCPKQRDKASR